jgi:hypothetical protein
MRWEKSVREKLQVMHVIHDIAIETFAKISAAGRKTMGLASWDEMERRGQFDDPTGFWHAVQ